MCRLPRQLPRGPAGFCSSLTNAVRLTWFAYHAVPPRLGTAGHEGCARFFLGFLRCSSAWASSPFRLPRFICSYCRYAESCRMHIPPHHQVAGQTAFFMSKRPTIISRPLFRRFPPGFIRSSPQNMTVVFVRQQPLYLMLSRDPDCAH